MGRRVRGKDEKIYDEKFNFLLLRYIYKDILHPFIAEWESLVFIHYGVACFCFYPTKLRIRADYP